MNLARDGLSFTYVKTIVDYAFSNMNVNVGDIINRIVTKLLDPAKGLFITIATGLAAEDIKKAAMISAYVCKIVTYMVNRIFIEFDKYDYLGRTEVDAIIKYSHDLTYAVNLLGSFGLVDDIYMGIPSKVTVALTSPSATEEQAYRYLLQGSYSSGDPDTFDASRRYSPAITLTRSTTTDLSTYVMGAETYQQLSKLVKMLIIKEKFPRINAADRGHITLIDTFGTFIAKSIISDTHNSLRESEGAAMSTVNRASLHWLSNVVNVDTGLPGVSIQGPDGDNNNVLDSNQIKSVDVGEIGYLLSMVGKLRFDTVFLRNVIFIVNLYRSVRMKLQRDLVYSKDVIMKSVPITRPQLTEFYQNQIYQQSPSYSLTGMYNRFNY